MGYFARGVEWAGQKLKQGKEVAAKAVEWVSENARAVGAAVGIGGGAAAVMGQSAMAADTPVVVALPTSLEFGTLVNSGLGIIGTVAGAVAAAGIVIAVIIGGIQWARRTFKSV